MKKKLKTLIVEDEVWPRKHMVNLVEKSPYLQLAGIASTFRQFKEEMRKHSYDLILLDIELHGESSFEFLKESRFDGFVVVTTGSHSHAIEAFDLDVLDYLTKPVQKVRFNRAIQKALKASGMMEEKTAFDEEGLEKVLIHEYSLSKSEVAICIYIYRGIERAQIEEFLGVGSETLKSHLRKIYKKTIELDSGCPDPSHGKFQRLTAFLFSLKP